MCSVPRGRYSLLGHRAALALAHEPEGGDSFAAFLRSTLKEEEVRSRAGWAGRHKQRVRCMEGDHCTAHRRRKQRWSLVHRDEGLALEAGGAWQAGALQVGPAQPSVAAWTLPFQAVSDRTGEALAASKNREVSSAVWRCCRCACPGSEQMLFISWQIF